MKVKLFLGLAITVIALMVIATAQTFTVASLTPLPGDSIAVPVSLDNPTDVSGLQFDISKHSDLTYMGATTIDRATGYSIDYQVGFFDATKPGNFRADINGNLFRFILYSAFGEAMSPGTGQIMTLNFDVSQTASGLYDITPSNLIAVSPLADAVPLTLTSATISIVVCVDNDGDGYGADSGTGCTYSGADCDDNNVNVYPGATELCNGVDDNCDVFIDETFNVGQFCTSLPNSCGDVNNGSYLCDSTRTGTFCDAGTSAERVGYGDVCISSPNNCGDTNAGANICAVVGVECNVLMPLDRPATTAYFDNDADGYGDLNSPVDSTCGIPQGAIDNNLDCDDIESVINPGALGAFATEGEAALCDGIDNNCDGIVDDGCPICIEDEDGDKKRHFQTTKGTARTDDDTQDKNVLAVRGVGYDNYKGDSNDKIFVIVNGQRLNVESDSIPAGQLITGIEIESRELVPLASNIPKKNSIKVKHVLKSKDGDNLFADSGRYFSLWNPFFRWIYTWDTETVDNSGDPDYEGFASLGITTDDEIRVHVDLKPLECKDEDNDDNDDDGVPDHLDDDDDDDGIPDDQDAYPNDHDNDGKDDKDDDDDDNDGKKDNKDKHVRDKDRK